MNIIIGCIAIILYLYIGMIVDTVFNPNKGISPTVMIFWPLVIIVTVAVVFGAVIYALIYVFRHGNKGGRP